MQTSKRYIATKEHRHFCVGDVVEIKSKVTDVPSNLDRSKFGTKAIEVEAFVINKFGGTNHFIHHYNSTAFAELLQYLELKKDANS